jgi:putative salt-induced outer membrane protein YdiY
MNSRFSLKFAVLATLTLLAAWPAQGAIVNTLRGFSDHEEGWSGGLAGSYDASGGNTEETSLNASAQLQWRRGAERVRLIGSGKRTSSGGTETARAVTGHLRHNHRLSERWSTLAFLQAQENPFQRLKSRTLVGVGGRLDFKHTDDLELAIGAAHMWERERLEGSADHSSFQRLSVFLTAVWKLRKGVELDGLFFYQPEWSDFGDWRFFGTVDLNVELAANLTLFTGLRVEHDSRPPALVEETDWTTTTGFKVGF